MLYGTCTGQRVVWITIALLMGTAILPGAEPLHQQIDKLLVTTEPTSDGEQSSDTEFLRRVMLDFAGRIPTADEVRAFNTLDSTDKRQQLVDDLLSRPSYARRMRDQMHVMLMERLGDDAEWLTWLEHSFRDNKPWNRTVREILDPDAEHEVNRGAAYFWTKRLENYGQNPIDYPALTRDVGRLFLGVDLQCAQCHDHLYIDEYKQADYHGLFAFVGQTSIRKDVKFPAVAEKVMAEPLEFTSVFTQETGTTGPRLPRGEELAIPTFPKGEEFEIPPDKKTKFPGRPKFRPLSALAAQVTQDDNTAFARNSVNRFWFLMFGRGQVQPLDLHHADNPATHPELLDLLTHAFIAHQYDVKWLLRELALTSAYQRTGARQSDEPQPAVTSYTVFQERPLSAEQLLASISIALGHPKLQPAALGEEATPANAKDYEQVMKRFRETFANIPRDPEGDYRPSVKAALFLMNDDAVLKWFRLTEPGTTLTQLVALDNAHVAEDLYLTTLSRLPTESETVFVNELLSSSTADRTQVLSNLLWGLVASAEFSLNH